MQNIHPYIKGYNKNNTFLPYSILSPGATSSIHIVISSGFYLLNKAIVAIITTSRDPI